MTGGAQDRIAAADLAAMQEAGRAHRRIGDVEVLRAIAVAMVLLEHMPYNLVYWSSGTLRHLSDYFGFWTGVDLFFAISGFVIARSLLPALETAGSNAGFFTATLQFWIKRAWRLLPSGWLWLVVPILLAAFFNHSHVFGTVHANVEALVSGILNLANFRLGETYGRVEGGVSFVYWSLSLEEQFYLFLPLAVFCLRRHLVWLLLALAVLQFRPALFPIDMMLRSGALALGVLLAIWTQRPSYRLCEPQVLRHRRGARIVVLLLPLFCLAALGSDHMHLVSFRLGPIALLSAGLVWIASYDRDYLMAEGVPKRVLLWLASRSYGIYLIHVPVYFLMHELWFRFVGAAPPHGGQAGEYVLAGLLLVLAISEVNYRLVEQPLRLRGIRIAGNFGRARADRPDVSVPPAPIPDAMPAHAVPNEV